MHTPELPAGSLVLVTGVTGFVGSHVTLELLKSGYKVRGIIRTADKATFLKEHAFKEYKDQFHCMVIPDIEVKGAFDEAVKGWCQKFSLNFLMKFQMWMPSVTLLRPSLLL
jgi:nucleoside-diphosphate-sugar epimerase